ncbi:hypothetical protein [Mesorhizobium sp. M4B.F.Ca.ET.017.02.2.1]|uniref:hypothetical protein n=1 Tax=Mesorhizobium sp. M4B.F.Ca.ET.017.02.2.1 TaxID=2496649 RepID=UPI000FCBDB10|nr:hypothetical protein [Mesorhizobium sp. M4B.F.Ca.ET.017.02.2.1]RVD25459.1 hypothetical protein EN738_14095 [Mesorhizobium sp. M4B.F.Ca.ET.017.02.2.1]
MRLKLQRQSMETQRHGIPGRRQQKETAGSAGGKGWSSQEYLAHEQRSTSRFVEKTRQSTA